MLLSLKQFGKEPYFVYYVIYLKKRFRHCTAASGGGGGAAVGQFNVKK